MHNMLKFETRKKIMIFIEQNPGANLSIIAEKLHLSSQLVDYHLLYLNRHGIAIIIKEDGFKRCYIKGTVSINDKKILPLLRQEIPLQIILYLLKNPHSRYCDILHSLPISSPLFSYHLRKLVKHGIVIETTEDSRNGYIVCHEHEIIDFLIRYQPASIMDHLQQNWIEFLPSLNQ
ncbi:MAG: winged helix-turn-helix transcriptional regulator [Methanobacteriota archaeon]